MFYTNMSTSESETRLLCDLLNHLFELYGCERLLQPPATAGIDINRDHRLLAAQGAADIIVSFSIAIPSLSDSDFVFSYSIFFTSSMKVLATILVLGLRFIAATPFKPFEV